MALAARGDDRASSIVNGWSDRHPGAAVLHLLIPFGGLLSRHVKRRIGTLLFWAVWLLCFHYLDLYWLIMPEYGHGFQPEFD